jgi:uncharacterized OsmC-like protein
MPIRTASARWEGTLTEGTKEACPISRLLSPGAEITLIATLV